MACFKFHQMRVSLNGISSRSHAAVQRTILLPPFSGLHSLSQAPIWLTERKSDCCTLDTAPQNGANVVMIRHGRRVAKLGRPQDQRKALVRNLTTEVLRHGRIKTTEVKAKAIRKYVDKMIQLAKRGDLHARRQALAFIYDKEIVKALFEGATSRYSDRNSGYCRVIREAQKRRGDGAPMAVIELV